MIGKNKEIFWAVEVKGGGLYGLKKIWLFDSRQEIRDIWRPKSNARIVKVKVVKIKEGSEMPEKRDIFWALETKEGMLYGDKKIWVFENRQEFRDMGLSLSKAGDRLVKVKVVKLKEAGK